MKKLIFLFLSYLIISPVFAQWSVISSESDGLIHFINDTLGFGRNQRTTDGGYTWDTMPAKSPFSVFFTDPSNGHALYNTITGPPTYQRSTDGGKTWIDLSANFPTPYGGAGLQFVSTQTGFGFRGDVLFKTSNAGGKWDSTFYRDGYIIRSYEFLDSNIGYVDAQQGWNGNHYLFRTSNGGDSWDSSLITFSVSLPFTGLIDVLSEKEIIAISTEYNKSEILYSSDRGLTWLSRFKEDSLIFYDMDFPDRDTGYIVGINYKGLPDTSLILKTYNSGLTWTKQKTNYPKFVARVDFITGRKGWVLGTDGDLLYTNSGGDDPSIGIESHDVSDLRIFPNPSRDGHIRIQSTDSGIRQISVMNILGETLRQSTYKNSREVHLQLPETSGLYFINVDGVVFRVVRE